MSSSKPVSRRHIDNELDHSYYVTSEGKILDEFYSHVDLPWHDISPLSMDAHLVTHEIQISDLPRYAQDKAVAMLASMGVK